MLISELQSLHSSAELADLLHRSAANGRGTGRLSLGVIVRGQRFVAGLDGGSAAAGNPDEAILLGCLMKVLTATLVMRVAGTPDEWQACEVSEVLLDKHHESRAQLRGIKLGHLLNHTHGLDDSLVWKLPRASDGSIDSDALCTMLTANPPISEPGNLQSYGCAGAWLWAAILERKTRLNYAQLLFQHLLDPLKLGSIRLDGGAVCPAGSPAGAEQPLSMVVDDLLRFLEWHMQAGELDVMRQNPHPLPGWAAGERGVCQGWKHLGDGWYGHNSVLPNYSSFIRIHPASQIGIVFGGARTQAFATFARLFARALPEFTDLLPPRDKMDGRAHSPALNAYEGLYKTGALQIAVTHTTDDSLTYRATWRTAPAHSSDLEPVALRAMNQGVFFPKRNSALDMPFLQFLHARPDGKFEYLWNGKCLWRRH